MAWDFPIISAFKDNVNTTTTNSTESVISLADLKYAAKHFPYTVKEQMELDGYGETIDINEVQDE